jgi:hypothetical protein
MLWTHSYINCSLWGSTEWPTAYICSDLTGSKNLWSFVKNRKITCCSFKIYDDVMQSTDTPHYSFSFTDVHMARQHRCVFINYNWINQLSNTTIWWLDICCLLLRYQLHVSALMAIFRLIDWQQICKKLYFGMRLVYGGLGLGLDGGTRYRVCWVGRVMWVHEYYCAGLDNKYVSSYTLACVLCMVEGGWGWMGVRDLVRVE